MTHIDPYAPADSPLHPSNWVADVLTSENPMLNGVPLKVLPEDDAPVWIRVEGEPVYASQDNADEVADARWEEYTTLLRKHGDPKTIEIFDAVLTADWPEGMPTLSELREREAQAVEPKMDAAADLAAKLAALAKDGGL